MSASRHSSCGTELPVRVAGCRSPVGTPTSIVTGLAAGAQTLRVLRVAKLPAALGTAERPSLPAFPDPPHGALNVATPCEAIERGHAEGCSTSQGRNRILSCHS